MYPGMRLLFELLHLFPLAGGGLEPDDPPDPGVTGEPLNAGQEAPAPHPPAQLRPHPGHGHQGQAPGTRTRTADQILCVKSVI